MEGEGERKERKKRCDAGTLNFGDVIENRLFSDDVRDFLRFEPPTFANWMEKNKVSRAKSSKKVTFDIALVFSWVSFRHVSSSLYYP